MNTIFTSIAEVIKNRRSIKPFALNGKKIPNEHISAIIELADWAPTHGFTEPWRFVVYEDPVKFCDQHAELYRQTNLKDSFSLQAYEKLLHQGDNTSHVIIVFMKRGDLPKIPVFEEIAAASCAVQNLLLGATALNIASLWSTGGMALTPEFKTLFNLGQHDHMIGILYLGYADEHPVGKRMIPLEQKIVWIR